MRAPVLQCGECEAVFADINEWVVHHCKATEE